MTRETRTYLLLAIMLLIVTVAQMNFGFRKTSILIELSLSLLSLVFAWITSS